MMRPEVSVVIVGDYAAGMGRASNDLAATLAALARQTFTGATEILLCEDAALDVPDTVSGLLPTLRILRVNASALYELKNAGMEAASAEVVAILDGDCAPAPDWLSTAMAAVRANPGAAVISGKTVYAGSGLTERVLGLLTRSYLDPGAAGPTRFISNNNAVWRRAAYLAHPMPTRLGPFASRLQSESLIRDGARLLFEPAMRVVHEFEGWRMEADIRRNIGYGTVITRLHDPSLPFAWLVAGGKAAIPLIAAGKTLNSWRDCFRCASAYGVRWHEVPLALVAAVVVHALEVPGMWQAFHGKAIADTAYR